MLLLTIQDDDPSPAYRQIVDGVRSEVAAGRLSPGERLPSVRELATQLNLNVNTVHKAYQLLQQMKIVVVRRARGVIVAPNVQQLLGSQAGQEELRTQISILLREAERLGFSAEEVAQIILQSK